MRDIPLAGLVQLKKHVKAKLSRNKSWRHRREKEWWALILTFTFGTTGTTDLSAVSAGRTLLPKKVTWYPFLLKTKRTPGLLHADSKYRSLKNLQGPYWEPNKQTPVMWRSASSICGTVRCYRSTFFHHNSVGNLR